MSEKIQDRARGRWRDLLQAIGVPATALTGKHMACPFCGGKDRFRFDDKAGNGTFFCTHCGAGSGVDFAMKWMKCDFITAKKEIEKHLPSASVTIQKATRSVESLRDRQAALWSRASALRDGDLVAIYLAARGLTFSEKYPSQLRFASDLTYIHEDKSKSRHPAMLAKFVSPDAKDFTLHYTYLDPNGGKAKLPKQKANALGPMPAGGAVRLAPSSDVMGIAEGIETALSAMAIFEFPVWSALSAGGLVKWKPPPTARNIVIFGDNDASLAGQNAAYGLGYRLKTEGYSVEVRIPDGVGQDWNDVLIGRKAA